MHSQCDSSYCTSFANNSSNLAFKKGAGNVRWSCLVIYEVEWIKIFRYNMMRMLMGLER